MRKRTAARSVAAVVGAAMVLTACGGGNNAAATTAAAGGSETQRQISSLPRPLTLSHWIRQDSRIPLPVYL
mgnify:CR=1 FL=1